MNKRTDKLKRQAQSLLTKQQFGEAKTLYSRICAIDHQDAKSWFVLGAINGRLGMVDEVIVCCRKAIGLQEDFPAAYYNLSLALQDKGDLESAIENCRQALRLQPSYMEAYYSLGVQLASMNRFEDAAASFRKALALSPRFVVAHFKLGNALSKLQKFDEAIQAYQAAITLQPHLAEAQHALGSAFYNLGRVAEAEKCYQAAIEINPNLVQAYSDLGNTSISLEKYDQAIACYVQGIKLKPDEAGRYIQLGAAYLGAGRRDEAKEIFEQALRIDPNSGEAAYHLISLGEDLGSDLRTAASSFIADVFEQYAPFFDKHMACGVQCKIPEMLNLNVSISLGSGTDQLDILDLGCGTGLCGMLFHDRANRLVGIDLSPKMVAQALQRGVYDEVHVGDIVPFLRELSDNFDLVIAADVFIYIADLEPIFCEVSRLLRPDGLFAFSLETGKNRVPTPTAQLRILHSLEYMKDLAAAHGLSEVSVIAEDIRVGVRGFIVVLRNTGIARG